MPIYDGGIDGIRELLAALSLGERNRHIRAALQAVAGYGRNIEAGEVPVLTGALKAAIGTKVSVRGDRAYALVGPRRGYVVKGKEPNVYARKADEMGKYGRAGFVERTVHYMEPVVQDLFERNLMMELG